MQKHVVQNLKIYLQTCPLQENQELIPWHHVIVDHVDDGQCFPCVLASVAPKVRLHEGIVEVVEGQLVVTGTVEAVPFPPNDVDLVD